MPYRCIKGQTYETSTLKFVGWMAENSNPQLPTYHLPPSDSEIADGSVHEFFEWYSELGPPQLSSPPRYIAKYLGAVDGREPLFELTLCGAYMSVNRLLDDLDKESEILPWYIKKYIVICRMMKLDPQALLQVAEQTLEPVQACSADQVEKLIKNDVQLTGPPRPTDVSSQLSVSSPKAAMIEALKACASYSQMLGLAAADVVSKAEQELDAITAKCASIDELPADKQDAAYDSWLTAIEAQYGEDTTCTELVRCVPTGQLEDVGPTI